MTAFWTFAGRYWPPAGPTHELVARLGADEVASLHAVGVLDAVAIRPYDTVRCPECHGNARVIYEGPNAVAVCTGDFLCPDVELGPAPSRSVLRVEGFNERLARSLELAGSPGRPATVTPLGTRRFGEVDVAFDLCASPHREELSDALAALARRGPRVRVVLVPDAARIRADAPREICDVDLVWLGLNEVVRLERGFTVDLTAIVSRLASLGVAVPFSGLIVGETGATWGGRPVLGTGQQRAIQLLRALAARPGDWVSRRDLWRVVSPGEFTRTGKVSKGVNPDSLDGQLRGVVLEVREALAAAGLPEAVPNRRGDEVSGAYRLALAPDQVRRG